MSDLSDRIKKIDWTKGIISAEEAERFVSRFARVLLKKALENKKDDIIDEGTNGDFNS